MRLLAPDIGILLAGSFISRMCHKLVKLPRGAASSGALQGLQDPNVEVDGEELEVRGHGRGTRAIPESGSTALPSLGTP